MSKKQQFSPEYKKEVVRLVTEQGKKITEVHNLPGVPLGKS